MSRTISQLLILLHGYGGQGQNFIFIKDYLKKEIENLEILMPNAPFIKDEVRKEYQWFELHSKNQEDQLSQIQKSLLRIKNYLDDASKKYKVPYEKILLGGFSQGGMMSLYSATQIKKRIQGVIVFSGKMILVESLKNAIKIPVFLSHGSSDKIIPHNSMIESEQQLKKHGFYVTTHTAKNIGHDIDKSTIEKCIFFIKNEV